MHTVIRKTLAMGVAALALVGFSGCGGASASAETINVVSSVNQWGTMAQALGGDHVQVTSLLSNANADAHDYEPTSQDIAAISRAQVIVVNGADYDHWASKAAEGTKAVVVDVAEAASVKEGANPHLWFSAQARQAAAKAIVKAYRQVDQNHAKAYDRQLAQWDEQEQELEQDMAAARESIAGKPYAATESVADYLMDDLGLKDVTPRGYAQAAANESEPTPADLRTFSELLTAREASVLVVNTQEGGATVSQLSQAAKSANVPIVEVSEHMPQQYDDVHAWMRGLVKDVQTALA